MAQTTLSCHLYRWADRLAERSETPRLEAEVIFKHVSGLSDAQLIIQADQTLSSLLISKVDQLIEHRQQGKPVAYIVNQREFYALPLSINNQVLIPRPETELLVDKALALITTNRAKTLLDLGTGSGAIALAIAHNAPALNITAIDFDQNALKIARQNAQHLGLDNIRFVESDWYTALDNKQPAFDIIVANPPYIAPGDAHLEQGDLRFEPRSALVSESQGLADLKHIIQYAPSHLPPQGYLLVEHGYDQASAVQALFSASGFKDICTLKDLSQNDRISFGHI